MSAVHYGSESKVDEQEVQPQQYEEIARILVQQIASLIERDGFVPPLGVSLTDADGHMVSALQMDAYGDFRDLRDRDVPLRARFPIAAVVSDKNGKEWRKFLSAGDVPSLE